MGHALKLITFYVQKHIVALGMCHKPPLVRDKPLGAPASVKLVYCAFHISPTPYMQILSVCLHILFISPSAVYPDIKSLMMALLMYVFINIKSMDVDKDVAKS